ncbi:SET and MYND domain-containing protein 4-like [Penaeus indicus]|uniref:SET and MYND domain-containing protein 4-like n=1 Tax=Penaeus indicus TaxID=29960 RepID=UPI00300C5DAC
MDPSATFHQLFSNLISELKASEKVLEVSSNFGPQKSLRSMFSYLWDLEVAQQCLSPTLLIAGKSDAESDRLRAEGNKCYQKKMLDKALKLYNLSIMSATHPALPVAECHEGQSNDCCVIDSEKSGKESNQSDLEEYRSLSLGYANRSAVLLELEQYDKCVCDIDAALRYGYPKLLHSKLAERKAKCFIAQKRASEAKAVLESALKDLAELSLDESKSKNSREALQNLVKECESNESDTHSGAETFQNDHPIDLSSASKEKLLFSYQTPTAPQLVDSNSTIPALSASVRLAYTPSQGRYLAAERDIHPGDVLVAEAGYCNVLHLDSSLRTHCSNCLSRCLTPVPCPSCTRVVFCSSSCCIQGLASFHRQECNILPTLAHLDMGKNSVLAYRILTQTTHKKLKALMPELLEESNHKAPESLGFNIQGIYSSSDYRTIYHLVHNKERPRLVCHISKTGYGLLTRLGALGSANRWARTGEWLSESGGKRQRSSDTAAELSDLRVSRAGRHRRHGGGGGGGGGPGGARRRRSRRRTRASFRRAFASAFLCYTLQRGNCCRHRGCVEEGRREREGTSGKIARSVEVSPRLSLGRFWDAREGGQRPPTAPSADRRFRVNRRRLETHSPEMTE